MASLVKIWITRYIDKEGRRVSKGTPGAKKVKEGGKYKRVPLFTDKTASSVRLAEMVKGVERGESKPPGWSVMHAAHGTMFSKGCRNSRTTWTA
jgi:hypothetical protein